jgi:2'-5' RNA ligase
MYLWIGCKLPEEFEQEIRRHCLTLNRQIGLDTAAFLLPQHISLKISFQTDRADAVLSALESYLSDLQSFQVEVLEAEQQWNILWLTVAENETLNRLHRELDAHLETHFGIPQHAFDKCFKFHSTLFMDADSKKVSQMRTALENYSFRRALKVDTFLLGESETGSAGTYRVVRQIKV